jgi:predicted metal-dependent peptidase
MWKTCDTNYNLSRHLIPFLQDVPFWAEISRHVTKQFSTELPTLAVCFDPKADELCMVVNPYFMGGGKYQRKVGDKVIDVDEEGLTNWETRGVLTHEFSHLVFGHLSARRRDPADKWNIGTDLAINSIITTNSGRPRDLDAGVVSRPLPKCALIPGQRPWIDPAKFDLLPDWQKEACTKLADLIEKLPSMKSSEYYFHRVIEDAKANGYDPEGVQFVIGSMDDHGGWDDVPEEMQEYIEGKVKAIVEKAVRHADSQADGWGNIPSELREEIRRSVSNIVNWRAVLRQFVGMIVRGKRATSIKRINKRYPYIHPGTKRGYTAKLLVAIDESGSVGDDMLEMFFAELEQLTKKVDVTLLHFDCSCDMKDVYEWKKGTRPKLRRMKGGGTNFDAPTNLVNDPKNRGRWDGMLIMTDGQAPSPGASRIKRGWILGQGCKLNFESSEIQIHLSKERSEMSGAWR